jgi:hypothetical protein
MLQKRFLLILITSLLLTSCGVPVQYHPVEKIPTPTQVIEYLDEPTPEFVPTPYPQVLPSLNPDLNAFSIRIQAVLLANDDGSDLSSITISQIMQWIDKANLVYSQAGVRFYFEPSTDMNQVTNSMLNNITGSNDPNWPSAVNEGNLIVQQTPGKIVVFFRNNQPSVETGSWEEDFILMPSSIPEVCGQPDDTLLAHKIGLYLGLKTTFSRHFGTIQEAEKAYESSGFSSTFFDGDNLLDTPPDPFISHLDYICGNKLSIKISNADFNLSRGNLMSFYQPRSQLTPEQISRLRFVLALRSRNGSRIPSNQDAESPIQFEDLPLTYRSWCDPQIKDLSGYLARGWSSGSFYQVPAGYGSTCTFEFSIPSTGTYEMVFYATRGPDYGTLEITMDDWILNDAMDLYSQYSLPTGPISFGVLYLEEGVHTLSFRVVRAALDSTNFFFGLDALTINPKER